MSQDELELWTLLTFVFRGSIMKEKRERFSMNMRNDIIELIKNNSGMDDDSICEKLQEYSRSDIQNELKKLCEKFIIRESASSTISDDVDKKGDQFRFYELI